MRLRINNTFHNTSTTVIIKTNAIKLNSEQVKRVERVLLDFPWSEHTEVEGYEDFHFEPEIHDETGKVVGAYLVRD